MNLGFDLDECIGMTAQRALDHANEIFQVELPIDMLESFFFDENTYSDDPDEQKAVEETLLHAVFNQEIMFEVEPYEGAVKALQRLKHQGHKIFIITKRRKEDEDMTYSWLRKHKVPFDGVGVTHLEDKGYYANKFNLDFFLDDLEDNLYEMHKAKARWKKGLFLMTRPWNAHKFIDSTKITRVNDWDDVLQAVSIGNRLRG